MFEQQVRAENLFLTDVSALRARATRCLDAPSNREPAPAIAISLLQTVLAAEIVCVLRYTMMSVSQDGLKNGWIGAEFQEQANDERKHMTMAARRIEQLGGTPDYQPQGLALASAALGEPGSFATRPSSQPAANTAPYTIAPKSTIATTCVEPGPRCVTFFTASSHEPGYAKAATTPHASATKRPARCSGRSSRTRKTTRATCRICWRLMPGEAIQSAGTHLRCRANHRLRTSA